MPEPERAGDWNGKERRNESPSRWRRWNYRLQTFADSLAEERILLAVALLAVFVILAVLAVGISSVNRRNETEAQKTRHLVSCVVEAFVTDGEVNREQRRVQVIACLQEVD